jgi:hypothetical protein
MQLQKRGKTKTKNAVGSKKKDPGLKFKAYTDSFEIRDCGGFLFGGGRKIKRKIY